MPRRRSQALLTLVCACATSAVQAETFFIGSGLWSTPSNWTATQLPSASNGAVLANGKAAQVKSPAIAKSVLLDNPSSSNLETTLLVESGLTVVEGLIARADLTVATGGAITVGEQLSVDGSVGVGRLIMAGGNVSSKIVANMPGGQIRGAGTIASSNKFVNDGDVNADGGVLYFSSFPGVVMDLDGQNNLGDVRAQNGNLKFTAGNFSDFHGDMTVKEGAWIEFADRLDFVNSSSLNFENGSGGTIAEFRQGPYATYLTFDGGQLDVALHTTAKLTATSVEFRSHQALQVADDAVLQLHSPTTIDNSNHSGAGTVYQNGALYVKGESTLQFDRYDLDGESEAGYLNLAANAKLTMKVNSLDAGQEFQGDIMLNNNSELSMNINSGLISSWTLKGTMTMNQGSDLSGSSWLTNQGTIEVPNQASAVIKSPLDTRFGSNIQLGQQSRLHVQGPVNLRGGTLGTAANIKHDTKLTFAGNISVLEDTTIHAGHFDWDGIIAGDQNTIIQPLKRLTIRAGEIGDSTGSGILSGTEGFNDTVTLNSGQLDVLVGTDVPGGLPYLGNWSINPTGKMYLNHTTDYLPTVKGSIVVNKGLVSGEGRFESHLTSLGVVDVGHSEAIGYIHTIGNYNQGHDAQIKFEIGGVQPKTGYDQLVAENKVNLDGKLIVDLVAGFKPQVGATFRIVDATAGGQVAGTFSDKDLPFGKWATIYTPTYVDLQLQSLDPDSDYDMDSQDLLILLSNWTGTDYSGARKTWEDGDLDIDGDVDSADLLDLLEQWTGALVNGSRGPRIPLDSPGGVLPSRPVSADLGRLSWQGPQLAAATFSSLDANLTHAAAVPEPVGLAGLVPGLGALWLAGRRTAQRAQGSGHSG